VSDSGPFRRPLNRPITEEERALVSWLLDHGEEGVGHFIPQVETLTVAWVCTCGCPTIDIARDERSGKQESERLISDYVAIVDRQYVGVLLFATEGQLSMLEVYSLPGTDKSFGLPGIQDRIPWDEFRNHPIPPRQNYPCANSSN